MRQRLKRWIFDGAIAGMEGFVEGCVSSSILLIACKSGTFGNALNGASPYTLATVRFCSSDNVANEFICLYCR